MASSGPDVSPIKKENAGIAPEKGNNPGVSMTDIRK